ncbi:MAG: hypothetical protein IJU63_08505 [Bacteroidales bacterium]|nr:hypothetical protein [Bacteroidales bacterium]
MIKFLNFNPQNAGKAPMMYRDSDLFNLPLPVRESKPHYGTRWQRDVRTDVIGFKREFSKWVKEHQRYPRKAGSEVLK